MRSPDGRQSVDRGEDYLRRLSLANRAVAQLLAVHFVWIGLLAASCCCAAESRVRFSGVYLDLDGTALDPSGRLLPQTIQCARAYQACGGRLGIATGRTLESAKSVIDSL